MTAIEKLKSDNDGEERQNGGFNGIDVFPLTFAHSATPSAEEITDVRREPLSGEKDNEDKKRTIYNAIHH